MEVRIVVGPEVPDTAYDTLVDVLRARLRDWQVDEAASFGPERPVGPLDVDGTPGGLRVVLHAPDDITVDSAAGALAGALQAWRLVRPGRSLTVVAPGGGRLWVSGQDIGRLAEQLVALLAPAADGQDRTTEATGFEPFESFQPGRGPASPHWPPGSGPVSGPRSHAEEGVGPPSYTGRPPGPPFDDDDDEW